MGRSIGAATTTDVAFNPGSAVAVTTSSTPVASANGGRVEMTITNDHATAIVYLSLGGTAAVSTGIRLNAAGGSYTTHAYQGAVTAIGSAAATVLVVEV
jgi:hypothetical protein